MPNPNRNTDGTFKKGERQGAGPGRPKGSRHRLSEAFLRTLADDFEKHGVKVIQKLREKHIETYGRLIASVLPKEIDLGEGFDGSFVVYAVPEAKDETEWVNQYGPGSTAQH